MQIAMFIAGYAILAAAIALSLPTCRQRLRQVWLRL